MNYNPYADIGEADIAIVDYFADTFPNYNQHLLALADIGWADYATI